MGAACKLFGVQMTCWRHVVVVWALLLAAAVAMHMPFRLPAPLSEGACQRLVDNFNCHAVLAGLKEQSAAAAGTTTTAAGAAAAEARSSGAPQLHIITIAGRNTPAEKIQQSPLMRGLPPHLRPMVKVLQAETLIGHGLKGFGAFGAKIIELYKFVSRPGVALTDLVMLTDWPDVVLDATAVRDIPAKFQAITRTQNINSTPAAAQGGGSGDGGASLSLALVFSAERSCWPDPARSSHYPRRPTPFRFLNAGGLIGHAGYIRALLEPSMSRITSWNDDQRWYTTAYLAIQERNNFFLDSNCEIFQTLHGTDVGGKELLFNESSGRWYNALTGTYPVLMHGNGKTKQVLFGKVVPKVATTWTWDRDRPSKSVNQMLRARER